MSLINFDIFHFAGSSLGIIPNDREKDFQPAALNSFDSETDLSTTEQKLEKPMDYGMERPKSEQGKLCRFNSNATKGDADFKEFTKAGGGVCDLGRFNSDKMGNRKFTNDKEQKLPTKYCFKWNDTHRLE